MATHRPLHASATAARSATFDRPASVKRPLPNGPCNYRDLALGAPCGCTQFWDKFSAELHEGSADSYPTSDRSTWCVCSHHACFHQLESRPVYDRPAAPLPPTNPRHQNRWETGSQAQSVTHYNAPRGSRPAGDELLRLSRSSLGRSFNSQADGRQASPHQGLRQPNSFGASRQPIETLSQPSTSGLPRVPSVCLLRSHELRPESPSQMRDMRRSYRSQSRDRFDGLGLTNIETIGDRANRPQSITSTVPDEVENAPSGFRSESEIASTQPNSITGENAPLFAQDFGSIDRNVDFSRLLPLLEVGDTIPDTLNPDDFLQSATEVATPSNSNTPDLRVADQAVRESKLLIDALTRMSNQQNDASDTRPNSSSTPKATGTVPTVHLSNTTGTSQEQLQQALKSASPQMLQRIVPYLNPLHSLLSSMPNVANSIQDLAARLDLLEQCSFSHVQPDEVNQQFEHFDGRILELEHRMDDHDKLHAAIDADQSSRDQPFRRRLISTNESFTSNHSSSGHSVTSTALVVTAMDRKDMETEFVGIKDRLSALESLAMPTTGDPWDVEVVLLPWGRDLRGIWFSPDEPMHDTSRGVTQDTEEWTQSRSLRSSSKSSFPFSDTENAWSSQAISDWANTADEWLSPKACGTNNLVYKRLKSRGFIRHAVLKSANSVDIQLALSKVFQDLIEHLEYAPVTDMMDQTVSSHPGLRASFIPLRKMMQSSRLRFLTHAEMASSALWTAQFLASGVMMRVSGGRKRLYVTQREAYLQQSAASDISWTWQRIRELPRFSTDADSQMEGADEIQLVPEADARESCWAYNPAYDQPPASTTSSFSSSHSAHLSLRPAERQWRRSITPTSILKNKQPISPLSEFHPKHPNPRRTRTVSTSLAEKAPLNPSKRRLNNSFDQVGQGQSQVLDQSRRESIVAIAPVSKPKRRRLTHSPSPRPADAHHHGQAPIWTTNTPRRSREPPSPFFSSHPELPRSNSDITSRSQRSLNVIGKNTPFAYATPHSGPLIGGHRGFSELGDEGDTEVDEREDTGSWHGVGGDDDDDDENGSGSDIDDDNDDVSDAVGGAEIEDPSISSSDDSGFGSEEYGYDEDEDEDEDVGSGDDQDGDFGAQFYQDAQANRSGDEE